MENGPWIRPITNQRRGFPEGLSCGAKKKKVSLSHTVYLQNKSLCRLLSVEKKMFQRMWMKVDEPKEAEMLNIKDTRSLEHVILSNQELWSTSKNNLRLSCRGILKNICNDNNLKNSLRAPESLLHHYKLWIWSSSAFLCEIRWIVKPESSCAVSHQQLMLC